ncbi:hypothetical protein [Methylocella sp.]|uniref:hypothetical protein n=1 Tax=Methylocella sp. TaxID=1978226 RepID=UPI003C247491
MSRKPARFTESDLNRVVKIAKRHGSGVDILPDGTIRILPLDSVAAPVPVIAEPKVIMLR